MANKPRPCWDPFNYYWGCRNVVLTDSPNEWKIYKDTVDGIIEGRIRG